MLSPQAQNADANITICTNTRQNTRLDSMNSFRRLTVLPKRPYATDHSAGGNQTSRGHE